MAKNGHHSRGGLEKQLDTLPHHEPSSNFADMVMTKVEGIEASQGLYTGDSASTFQRCTAFLQSLFHQRLLPVSTVAVLLIVAGVLVHSSKPSQPQYSYTYTNTGTPVAISTTVIADGNTCIDLSDGRGVLTLGGDSVVQLQTDGVVLQSGRVFFDMELKGREFRVYTRFGEVLVTGTEFFVQVQESKVVVTVLEGIVTFIKDTEVNKVPEGTQLEVTTDGLVLSRHHLDMPESAKPVSERSDRVESRADKPSVEVKSFEGYSDVNRIGSGFKRESVQEDIGGDGVPAKVGSSDNLENIFDE